MEHMPYYLRYRSTFDAIDGMFSFQAALLMAAYAQVAAEQGVRADTLEIGVHHGLSAIQVAALRANGSGFVAIDLFEEKQNENVSHSGAGSKTRFLSNMAEFYSGDLNFIRLIGAPSSSLKREDLGCTYSFCHIDGGHSAGETYGDMVLCSEILLPSGILVIDDYFNPNFPGVSEGAIRFLQEDKKNRLLPLAIGFNKVIFQKTAEHSHNAVFLRRFPLVPHTTTQLWGQTALHFASDLSLCIDLQQSTPHQLVPRDPMSMQVKLYPEVSIVEGAPQQTLYVPIRVKNLSELTLRFTDQPIGLSYHLSSEAGVLLAYDNRRQYFADPLGPGQERTIDLPISCPKTPGEYLMEIDLVWEGVCWFKEKGNIAPIVRLRVK